MARKVDIEESTDEQRKVVVCESCSRASCWQGIFYFDDAWDTGTAEKTISELKQLDLESEDYWMEP